MDFLGIIAYCIAHVLVTNTLEIQPTIGFRWTMMRMGFKENSNVSQSQYMMVSQQWDIAITTRKPFVYNGYTLRTVLLLIMYAP